MTTDSTYYLLRYKWNVPSPINYGILGIMQNVYVMRHWDDIFGGPSRGN